MRRSPAVSARAFGAVAAVAVCLSGCEAHWGRVPQIRAASVSPSAPRSAELIELDADAQALEKALLVVEAESRKAPRDPSRRARARLVRVALAELDARRRAWSADTLLPGSWLLPGRSSVPSVAWSDDARVQAWLEVARDRVHDVEGEPHVNLPNSPAPPPPKESAPPEPPGKRANDRNSADDARFLEEEARVEVDADALENTLSKDKRDEGSSSFKRSPPGATPFGGGGAPVPITPRCPPTDPLCEVASRFGGDLPGGGASDGTGEGRAAAMVEEVELPAVTTSELQRQVQRAAACLPAGLASHRIVVRATLVAGHLVDPDVDSETAVPLAVEACIRDALRRVRLTSPDLGRAHRVDVALARH